MSENKKPEPIVILRLPEVLRRIGLSRSSLYARIKQGSFPKPMKLGSSPQSASGWAESWINDWCLQQMRGDN